eukprot:2862230-Amphidinium_carterae.1
MQQLNDRQASSLTAAPFNSFAAPDANPGNCVPRSVLILLESASCLHIWDITTCSAQRASNF